MIQPPAHGLQPRPTRDEQARQEFVSTLRRHVLGRLAERMHGEYEETVRPAFERDHGRPPADGPEIHQAMKPARAFRFYSAVRTNAQEMVFASVIPGVERRVADLAAEARALREDEDPVGGSLTLDPDLDVPRNVTEVDVHLAPGSYHAEYGEDDVAAGALYDHSINVFAFGQFGRDLDDIGQTLSNYVRLKYPDFRPARILDCGCTVGHNTLPWARTFPDAEVHGIDVAPGVLRYASARAESLGVPVHFRQMDATNLAYPDASFDVVFSSMFLHELPLKDIRAFFREAYRVLKPGGVFWNMELPPNSAMPAYESFYLDWDSYYNNEPFYKPFRDQDYRGLCEAAGFAAEDFIEATLPRYSFVGEAAFREGVDEPALFDSQTGRMDPKGTRWYGFGAWKRA
ncbi:MAG: class I SAM-dependent methyltransferase [Gammaproteobacteria bacterium]